jgi:SAM-dependent methyltransferase
VTYVYRPEPKGATFADALAAFSARHGDVVNGAIDNISPGPLDRILHQAQLAGMTFESMHCDATRYRRFVADAGYASRYPSYYPGNQVEKSFEHWFALEVLDLQPTEVFIDIASEDSPMPEIASRLRGARSFSQDIQYAPGIVGNRIGGDACAMPLSDGFAAKAALTCSLEHFESDADVRLFRELARVLRGGGAVCVVPFYIYDIPATQTDPQVSLHADVPFDDGTTLFCAAHWGNRHARFYSPGTFMRRIALPMAELFTFRYIRIVNADAIDPSIYGRFALLATRR